MRSIVQVNRRVPSIATEKSLKCLRSPKYQESKLPRIGVRFILRHANLCDEEPDAQPEQGQLRQPQVVSERPRQRGISLALAVVTGLWSSVMGGRLAVFASLLMLLWPATGWAAPLPKPTYTSKTRFRIPFKIDEAALKRMDAREIQLHVSQNQGQTWELAQVLLPDGGKFEYVCSAEGEYWFAVKTLDGRRQLHPPRGTYETGLIVVVDTTNPTLDVALQQVAAGKVQLRWRATDTNLDINSLRIEYLTMASDDWVLLDLAPRARGETAWLVEKSGVVSVRGNISDLAGNSANARTQTDVDAANHPATKSRPIPQGKIATSPPDQETAEAATGSGNTVSSVPFPSPKRRETDSFDDDFVPPSPTLADTGDANPQTTQPIKLNSNRPRAPLPVSAPSKQLQTTPTLTGSGNESMGPQKLVSQHTRKAIPKTDSNHPAHRHRYVNSRRFQLGYKLEDIGPTGIGAVELFITEDDGRTWWKYGDDPDQKSPFEVEVPEDKEYGFAIRVRSGAGLSMDPPVPGEHPAIIVSIDRTAPRVELLPPRQGQGGLANRLLLRWEITEDHPAEKPVSIYYATQRGGPWEQISGWKEDTNGEFAWTVGNGVPAQFYLRVVARDAAGNVAKAETPQPIAMDASHPTAQFLDVDASEVSGPQ